MQVLSCELVFVHTRERGCSPGFDGVKIMCYYYYYYLRELNMNNNEQHLVFECHVKNINISYHIMLNIYVRIHN